MILRKIFLITLFIVAVTQLNAKFVQEIELNDGTILIGYIYRQQPGNFIVFYSEQSLKDPKSKYTARNRNYTIQWNDVKSIRVSAKSDVSWCYDKLTLKNGTTHLGRIEEQRLGVSMTIRLKNSDKRVVIKYKDLKQMEKTTEGTDKDIWLDRQYTNVLKLRDNSLHEGLIVMQCWSENENDCYVELLRGSGYRERIYNLDIQEYCIQLR